MKQMGICMNKLSISNIAWNKQLDVQIYALMKEIGFNGLEIAPTRIFREMPYSRLMEAATWAEELKKQYGFVISSMQSIWFGRQEQIFGTEEEREVLLNYTTLQDYEIKPCRRNSDIKASIMLFDFIVVSMFCTKVAKNTCSRICLLRINRNSWALSPRYFAKSFS